MTDTPTTRAGDTGGAPDAVVVVVDDLRTFTFDAVYFRTSQDAVRWLGELGARPVAQLWLDFDLGDATGQVDTAEPVADLLSEMAFNGARPNIGRIIIHSANPIGAARMARTLERWGYTVSRVDAAGYLA